MEGKEKNESPDVHLSSGCTGSPTLSCHIHHNMCGFRNVPKGVNIVVLDPLYTYLPRIP